MDWLDLPAVQGTLKSLLQHHSSKASISQCSAFLIVQLSHPYMTTGKTIVLTRWNFVCKVMSLFFNMLSRLVIAFLPKMGTTKDRNGMDVTEAEDINKRWQEYTGELYKTGLNNPDKHDGVVTHLE